MESSIHFLIIEDHEIIVWALTSIIEKSFFNPVLFTAATFEEGIKLIEGNFINLVILDIDVPGGNDTAMIQDLRKIQPQVQILIHTGADEEKYSLKYLSAGANGFISKKMPLTTISEALRQVLIGKKYISPVTHELIATNYFQAPLKKAKKGSVYNLSIREIEIIRLLLKGKWTKEIADALGLKLSTISTHKGRIFDKLDVQNIIELFRTVQKEIPELLEDITLPLS